MTLFFLVTQPLSPGRTAASTCSALFWRRHFFSLALASQQQQQQLPKAALTTAAFHTAVLDQVRLVRVLSKVRSSHNAQVEECIVASLAPYGRSLAFPDLCVPVLAALRRYKKATQSTAHRKQVSELINKLDQVRFSISISISFAC